MCLVNNRTIRISIWTGLEKQRFFLVRIEISAFLNCELDIGKVMRKVLKNSVLSLYSYISRDISKSHLIKVRICPFPKSFCTHFEPTQVTLPLPSAWRLLISA